MEQDISVTKKIDKIDEKLAEILNDKPNKQFKLPFKFWMQRGKLKKNYCLIMLLRTNGEAVLKFEQIQENGYVMVDDTPYDVKADYMMRYKRYPLLVIPEWNLKPITIGGIEKEVPQPFDAKKDLDNATKKGELSSTARTIIGIIEAEKIKQKSSMNWTTILIIGAVLIGGYLLLSHFGYI